MKHIIEISETRRLTQPVRKALRMISAVPAAAIWLAAIFVSCAQGNVIDEFYPVPDEGGVPDGKVILHLIANVGEYSVPATKAGSGDETLSNSPSPVVIVFTNPVDSEPEYVFSEAAGTTLSNDGYYTTVSRTTDPARVLVVANTGYFYDGENSATRAFTADVLNTVLAGKTLSASQALLRTVPLGTGNLAQVPYTVPSPQPIPMAGITGEMVSGIDVSTTIGTSSNPLQLHRVVAKAEVTAEANLYVTGAFVLVAAGAVNVPRDGNLFRENTTPIKSNIGNLANYLSGGGTDVTGIADAVNNYDELSTAFHPLYLYESLASENTCLIIRGQYKNTDYYYKLAFRDNNNAAIPIERNRKYSFHITSAGGPGYQSVAEAMTATASNLRYTITVSDPDTYDIISNGQYYLGFTNSRLLVLNAPETQDGLVALTAATDALNGTVTTNSIAVTGGQGLTVSPDMLNLSSTPGTPATTNIQVNLTADFSSGTITVRIGNLTGMITVKRDPPVSFTGGGTLLPDNDYVSAVIANRGDDDWLSLSADGTTPVFNKISLSTPGSLWIHARSNTAPGSVVRKGAVFYLVRYSTASNPAGEKGRIRVLASQAAN